MVNGRPVETSLPRLTPLLAFLRNDLCLNGPKFGCGLGECGACAVLIDGRLARACVLTLGDVAGRAVTTLEGLGADGRLDPVQEAFIASAAAQCGYCLNGMIMTARALIDCESGADRGRDPRGAALQSLPLRRACRDRRRRAACRDAGPRMTALQPQGLARADYLERPGTLAVVRSEVPGSAVDSAKAETLEPFVIVSASGEVAAFSGHVDLGTGVRTALAQIVADELDVAFGRVAMVLGDSAVAPDQGPTIASETIQLSARPLRRAAAQARHFLVARAADILGVPASDLVVENEVVRTKADDNRRVTYGELIAGARIRLALADDVRVKAASERRIVGASQPRVDLAAKATGELVYVHDMRVPGMLHGRVVRPPYAGFDSGDHVGRSLVRIDEGSIAHLPGIVATVVVGDFVGVVAQREEHAEAAMRALRVEWREGPRPPDLSDARSALAANPSRPRVLLDRGDVEGGLRAAAKWLSREYLWPYQLHGAIGPSAALADVRPDGARVWSGTQNPLWMRRDLALALDLAESAIEVVRMEAAGCYGRNGADDVTADAALLSRAVGRPVRVQLTRDQEHMWEPKGAAQLMTVDGGIDREGGVAAYDFATRYPSNAAPTLALLLMGKLAPTPEVTDMGDRTAIGPYDFANHRVTVHDMAPIAARGLAAGRLGSAKHFRA